MVNAASSFTKKIGNTDYIVSLKKSETATKTPDEKSGSLPSGMSWRKALRTATIRQPDKRNGGE